MRKSEHEATLRRILPEVRQQTEARVKKEIYLALAFDLDQAIELVRKLDYSEQQTDAVNKLQDIQQKIEELLQAKETRNGRE